MFLSNWSRRAFSTGLLVALVWGFGLSEAKAALGIIVTQTTVMPVGDPLAEYDFKLSLVAGNQLEQNDNITLLNIPNFDGNAHYVFVQGGFDFSQFFSINPGEGSSPGLTSIALVWTPSLLAFKNSDPVNNLPIGDLFVETNVEYPPASNSPLFDPINYTTTTHLYPSGDSNSGMGTTAAVSVPEPSSVAMLGVGVVSVLLTARGRRRPACAA